MDISSQWLFDVDGSLVVVVVAVVVGVVIFADKYNAMCLKGFPFLLFCFYCSLEKKWKMGEYNKVKQ